MSNQIKDRGIMVNRISELKYLIVKYSKEYYSGNPSISDTEFDLLIKELKNLNPNDPLLSTPGYGYTPPPGENKFTHHYPEVGSLDKIKYYEIGSYQTNNDIVSAPKLDGGSAVAYYYNGLLQRIVTRGDGHEGIDITRNLLHAVPHKVNNSSPIFAVRGEVLITINDFQDMMGANPRNKAVGLSQSKHATQDELSNLRFVAYSILIDNNEYPTKKDMLDKLIKYQFETINYELHTCNEFKSIITNKSSNLNNHFSKFFRSRIDNKLYPNDGIVNTENIIDKDNTDNFIYETSIAYKFEEESTTSTVRDIEWNITRTGRYVPVLIIDPIEISGSTVSRVTANNKEWLYAIQAGIGSKVEIIKANEVIPFLKDVIIASDNYKTPTHCKICGSKLEIVDSDIKCNNLECDSKYKNIVYNIWECIRPDGGAEHVLQRLLDAFYNNGISMNKDILVRFKDIISINENFNFLDKNNHYDKLVYQSIDNFHKKKIDIPKLITQANIPGIGEITAIKIAKSFNSDIKLFSDYLKYGFPNNILHHDKLNSNQYKLQLVYNIWKDKIITYSEGKPVNNLGWKIAVTGSVKQTRATWFKSLSKIGIKSADVGKGTKYLVSNKITNTSKFKKAAQLGIEIINEETFYDIISKELGMPKEELMDKLFNE